MLRSKECADYRLQDANMKKIVHSDEIKKVVKSLIYEANFSLPSGVLSKIQELKKNETNKLARETLQIIEKNNTIAFENKIPLCQDCGVVMVFLEIGQGVSIEGEFVEEVINDAVAEAYEQNFLRKSVVNDPLERTNTGTNTPAFIHTEIIKGDSFHITVYLKGGGSENMTSLRMFRPTDSMDIIIDYIEETVCHAGSNPCPPLFLGIGIGGTADTAILNAKKVLFNGADSKHQNQYYRNLEESIYERLNNTNVGPLGFGGTSTVAGVYIKEAPTHIATLPVALNLNCHSFRCRSAAL